MNNLSFPPKKYDNFDNSMTDALPDAIIKQQSKYCKTRNICAQFN